MTKTDTEKSRDLLRPLVSEVYGRLAGGTLQRGDVVVFRDINKVESAPHWIRGFFDEGRVIEEDALAFARFRKDMGTILDIGAHWGYMALSMRRAGSDCPILSFEALEAHRPCLDELKRLDRGNYDYLITPLSDSSRTVTLYGPVINGEAVTGLNSVDGTIFNDWHQEYLVSLVGGVIPLADHYRFQLLETKLDCRSLDDILANTKFSVRTHPVAAIKLVVEGHEAAVIRGGLAAIKRDLPFVVTEGGNRIPEVAQLMHELGYSCADRDGDRIVPSPAMTTGNRGYWFHESRREQYRSIGLIA
jgi:FkbM family methyltransferase